MATSAVAYNNAAAGGGAQQNQRGNVSNRGVARNGLGNQ